MDKIIVTTVRPVLTLRDRDNLLAFLARVKLDGKEAPAFVRLQTIIAQAKPEPSNEQPPDTSTVDPGASLGQ